jgi:hypothetical protein
MWSCAFKGTRRNFGWFRTFIIPRPYYDSSHWNYFRKSSIIKIISLSNIRPIIIYFHSSQCRLIPYLHQRPIFFQNKLIYCRHFRTYSRCAMFDWSDTVFWRRNVTRRRISNTVLQPRYWGREADSPEVCRLLLRVDFFQNGCRCHGNGQNAKKLKNTKWSLLAEQKLIKLDRNNIHI